MKRSKKPQAEKLSFRLAPSYAREVEEVAGAAGMTPNQFGRISTMAMAKNRFHHLILEVEELRSELRRFRTDFENALVRDEE